MITVKADQKGLEFVSDFARELPPGVRVDEKRLRQVLLNLLANAIRFTDRGVVTLHVGVVAPGRFLFEVRDTGIGMNEDQLKEIFQPFSQTGEIQRRLGGTGLGLTISRQFVRLMGGDIQVESKVGEGSRFWFELDVPFVWLEPAAPSPDMAVIGDEGPRKTVLVADDIAENRSVVLEMLGRSVSSCTRRIPARRHWRRPRCSGLT